MRLGLLYLTFVGGQTGKEECMRCLLAPKPRDQRGREEGLAVLLLPERAR